MSKAQKAPKEDKKDPILERWGSSVLRCKAAIDKLQQVCKRHPPPSILSQVAKQLDTSLASFMLSFVDMFEMHKSISKLPKKAQQDYILDEMRLMHSCMYAMMSIEKTCKGFTEEKALWEENKHYWDERLQQGHFALVGGTQLFKEHAQKGHEILTMDA